MLFVVCPGTVMPSCCPSAVSGENRQSHHLSNTLWTGWPGCRVPMPMVVAVIHTIEFLFDVSVHLVGGLPLFFSYSTYYLDTTLFSKAETFLFLD